MSTHPKLHSAQTGSRDQSSRDTIPPIRRHCNIKINWIYLSIYLFMYVILLKVKQFHNVDLREKKKYSFQSVAIYCVWIGYHYLKLEKVILKER